MKTGIFVLTKTVTNQKPDRRQTHNWLAQETWTEGMRFAVRRERLLEKERTRAVKVFELFFLDEAYAKKVTFYDFDDGNGAVSKTYDSKLDESLVALVDALVPANEPDDKLLWTFIKRGDSVIRPASAILFRLVREGVLTLAQVEEALIRDDNETKEST